MTDSGTFETQFVTEQKLLARSLQSAKVKPLLSWVSQREINFFERRYFSICVLFSSNAIHWVKHFL